MKITLTETHDVTLNDPIVEITEGTIDNHIRETFQPRIVFIDKEDNTKRYAQILPEQPYVNGTWTDEDVEASVGEYLKSIVTK